MQQIRKPKRDSIDRLRARVWFENVVFLSGGMTKQQLWKDIGFSRSTWFTYPKGTVPTEPVVNAVESGYPGTRQVLNANFWSILQGKKLSIPEIENEFRYFNSHLTANYQILDLNFWSENSAIEFPKLVSMIGSFLGEDDDHGMHFQVILSLMSLVKESDVEIWNELCRLYRTFFPNFATQIHWPFKAEIFDALDGYIRLHKKRGIVTIEDYSDDWSWRNQKLEIISVLSDHYSDCLYSHFHANEFSLLSIRQNLIDNVSSELSARVCSNEELMFHSWNLWEPTGILLLKILNEPMIDSRDISAELFITFLEQENFFNPYNQELLNYEYLMHIAKDIRLTVNVDFIRDTVEISSVRPKASS